MIIEQTDPLILVLIPVYNAEKTIKKCIQSIIDQTYKNIIIVAIDDCSTDNSYKILLKLSKKFNNLLVFQTPNNVGTYNTINLGLFKCKFMKFDFFLIHGSDDMMLPYKIGLQTKLTIQENKLFSIAGYERISLDNNLITKKNYGHSMAMYSKKIFEDLGYYDDTRFAGDSEFLDRCLLKYGDHSQYKIPFALTKCYLLENNITIQYPIGSKKRLDYIEKYKFNHQKMKVSNNYYLSSIWKEKNEINKKIVAGLATIKNRLESLKDTVCSILPQVDKLIIYQNGYYEIPDFLIDPKIEVLSSLKTQKDMGDAGKFFYLEKYNNCIYFSIDDDLIYPIDYVEKTLEYLRKYNYKIIVSSHGRILKNKAISYYHDISEYFPCLYDVEDERIVHFGGTGVMAFDTSYIKITFKDFEIPNVADIYVGLYAKKYNIPILVIPHKKGWIELNKKIDLKDTIWSKSQNSVIPDELIKDFI